MSEITPKIATAASTSMETHCHRSINNTAGKNGIRYPTLSYQDGGDDDGLVLCLGPGRVAFGDVESAGTPAAALHQTVVGQLQQVQAELRALTLRVELDPPGQTVLVLHLVRTRATRGVVQMHVLMGLQASCG